MEEPSDPVKEKPPQQKTGFAKQLASCDKTTRDRAVRLLESWMTAQNSVAIQDLKKIWKGLFYCVWHSDKRHVQADVIEKLAALVRTLDLGLSLSYFQVFILTIRREWSGIDHLRLDKFYLMLRRFLHYVFLLLDSHGWEKSVTESFMRVLAEESFAANDKYPARGINLQFVDVYLAELKEFLPLKVDALGLVFEPLYCVLARVSDKVLVDRVRVNVFDVLLDHGRRLVKRIIEEREGIGNEDVVEGDDDDDVQKFGCTALAMGIGNRVFELATAESTPQANRKVLYALHDEFGKLEKFCEVSEDSIFANGVRRDRGSAEDAAGFGLGKGEHMAKMAEEGGLDAGNKKKKVKTANSKKVKRVLDDGSQQGNGNVEVADEECLDKENKVKKRKSKKAKTLMGDENLPVHSEKEIAEEGNGIMEVADEECLDKENKVKKRKSKKVKTLMGDENLPVHSEMEIAEEGILVTSIGLKRKSKKAKTSMDEENEPVMKVVEKAKLKKLKAAGDGKRQPDNGQEIALKGSLEIGDVMKKIMKKKIKKTKKEINSDKAEGDEDSNVGVLAKKLKGSSELRTKKKSHLRNCEVDEAVEGDMGNSLHNEQNNGLASAGVSFDFGDSVVSNLHKEFEKVAAELGENMDAESMAFESLATSSSFESKKRKRAKNVSNEVKSSLKLSSDHENGICFAGSLHSNEDSSCGKMGEKSVKKVRFSLKRNIVWKPATPLPPESLRMPPSSTPRGSALKKGVPPGPIRIVKESRSPQRMRILTLSMRKGKRKLNVTPGTKVVRKRQSYVLQTNSV